MEGRGLRVTGVGYPKINSKGGVVIHQNDRLVKGFHFLYHMSTLEAKNFSENFSKI